MCQSCRTIKDMWASTHLVSHMGDRTPGRGHPARRTRREAVGCTPLLDRRWLWHGRGASAPCAVEVVDDAADGVSRRSAGVDAALGAAREAPEDVRAYTERRRPCNAVPRVSSR